MRPIGKADSRGHLDVDLSTLSPSTLIMKTVNNRASGRKGYEHRRCFVNSKSAAALTAASAVLFQTALVPKRKVTVSHFKSLNSK